jgi:tripeptidyl-peptidase-1
MPVWQYRAVSGYFSRIQSSPPYVNSSIRGREPNQFPFNEFNRHGRAYPDISLLAVNYLVAINGSFDTMDGTSASCPVVAAMVSLVNSARLAQGKPPLGWLNPAIYENDGSFARDVTVGKWLK